MSVKVTADAARRFLVARQFLAPARSLEGARTRCSRSSADSGRSSSTRSRSPAATTTSCCTRASPATSPPGATCSTNAVRSSRRPTRRCRSSRRASSPGSVMPWAARAPIPLPGARRQRCGGRARPRTHRGGRATVLGRLRAGERPNEELVRDAGERRAGRTRGVHRLGRDRARAPRRQRSVLRPPRTVASGRHPRARGAGARTAAAQAPVPVPRPRPPRPRRRRRYVRPYRRSAGAQRLRNELVERGALVPVEVEGVRGKRLVLAEELALLEASPEPPPSVAFIAPFDALLWDTALLASVFGFEYVWEGFFPPAKRRWGYYVLPIVFGDRFVGRIEPRIDRGRACVEVLDVWWEDGFAPRRADGFVDAMRAALHAYLRFACASTIEWPSHLGAEKRLFPARRRCRGNYPRRSAPTIPTAGRGAPPSP